jgi:hypothetical protein
MAAIIVSNILDLLSPFSLNVRPVVCILPSYLVFIIAAEYTAYLTAWGTAATEIAETFHQLDRDNDGYLMADELRQNAEEFFFSEDPAARGNWLVGPF